MEEIRLNDIAEDLLIIHKNTIDELYRLPNCADCIALYIFYYKTAKWQKSTLIKATDEYIKRSLKWGEDKIRRTKMTLKEHGLINVISKKDDSNKITGWFIEVKYIINKIENQNTQKPELEKARTGKQETNTILNTNELLNYNNKNNINVLEYLNERAGTHYRAVESNLKYINARLKNYTIDDLKAVIDRKTKEWKGTDMQVYLRPETLFNATKFESYINGLKPASQTGLRQRDYSREDLKGMFGNQNISDDEL